MNERISLGGVPVVGFGATPATAGPRPFFSKDFTPILYPLIPAVGGALLGYHIKKGTGAVVGGVVGGAVGGLVYFGAHFNDSGTPGPSTQTGPTSTPTQLPAASTWRRIPFTDVAKLKAGQQIAMAAAMPGGALIPPEIIAALKSQFDALANAPVNLPTKNFLQYPPGSKLPSDWPADDDLGANAYRISADVIADAPPEAANIKSPSSSDGTFEVWVRG